MKKSSKMEMPYIQRTKKYLNPKMGATTAYAALSIVLRFQIPKVSLYIRRLVGIICDAVTRRAARMAAAGIAGILKKIGRDGTGGGVISPKDRKTKGYPAKETVVAVEGDLYTNYKMFKDYLDEALEELLGKEVVPHIIIKMIEDGPGIGAAVLAASHPASSSGDTI